MNEFTGHIKYIKPFHVHDPDESPANVMMVHIDYHLPRYQRLLQLHPNNIELSTICNSLKNISSFIGKKG